MDVNLFLKAGQGSTGMQKEVMLMGLPSTTPTTLPSVCRHSLCVMSAPVELKVYHRRTVGTHIFCRWFMRKFKTKELALSVGLISALPSTVPCDDINTNVDTYSALSITKHQTVLGINI